MRVPVYRHAADANAFTAPKRIKKPIGSKAIEIGAAMLARIKRTGRSGGAVKRDWGYS